MKSVEELIESKHWSELTFDERQQVVDLADNEQTFNEMKQFFSGLDHLVNEEHFAPSPHVKESLDQIFQAKHPGLVQAWEATATETKIVPLYNRNWFRVAAILIICAGTIPLFLDNTIENKAKPSHVVAKATERSSETEAQINLPNDPKKTSLEKQQPLLASNQAVEQRTTTRPENDLILHNNTLITESIAANSASMSSEVDALSSSRIAVNKGLDKDLNPFQDEMLNSKTRTQPIDAAIFLEVIVPSY
jgi:hypothetical protein